MGKTDFLFNSIAIPKKYSTCLITAFFFSTTIFFFGPLRFYLDNKSEFTFQIFDVILATLILTLVILLINIILLTKLPAAIASKLLAVLLALGFLFWLQGNILVWDYGIFDGHDIPWGNKFYLGFIDTPIWILLLGIALLCSCFINKMARPLSFILVLTQAISFAILPLTNKTNIDFKPYNIDSRQQFAFSSHKNVIILVLDTFQTDFFQELLNEKNNFRNTFGGFIYFRNALSGSSSTLTSIPNILTGEQYDNSLPLFDFLKKNYKNNSLPLLLKQNKFRCDIFPKGNHGIYLDETIASNLTDLNNFSIREFAFLLDLSLFRQTPHFIKKTIYNHQAWFLSNLLTKNQLKSGITFNKLKRKYIEKHAIYLRSILNKSDKWSDHGYFANMLSDSVIDSPDSVFKFYHLWGIHPPLHLMNNSGKFKKVDFNHANCKIKAREILELTGLFLDKLKRIGVFHNSLIFIIGDHGPGVFGLSEINLKAAGLTEKQSAVLLKIKAGALPLILVKTAGESGQKPLAISDAPVCLGDIPATVVEELNIKADFPGKSFFSITTKENRKRRYLYHKGALCNSDGYMNKIIEYEVQGFSWLDRSWQYSGRIFKSAENSN